MSSKKKSRKSNTNYKRFDTECCYYCGNDGSTWDHVWPASAEQGYAPEEMLIMVRACQECNNIAGARCFLSLEEKRAHIQGHLEHKYRKVLAVPDWSEEELEELGHALRLQVEAGIALKKNMQRRINWRHRG